MTNEFLQALRVQTDGLRTKISHAYHATGNPTPRTTGKREGKVTLLDIPQD